MRVYAIKKLGGFGKFLRKDALERGLCPCSARKYIHSNDLVHMDLNAGNNFVTKVPIQPTYTGAFHHPNSADDGFEDIPYMHVAYDIYLRNMDPATWYDTEVRLFEIQRV